MSEVISATQTYSDGSSVSGATIVSGGTVNVSSGGTVFNGTINSGGILNISSGGTVSSIELESGGSLNVASGGTVVSAQIDNGVYLNLSSVAVYKNFTISNGATLGLGNGLVISGLTLESGSFMNYDSDDTLVDVTLSSNASLQNYYGSNNKYIDLSLNNSPIFFSSSIVSGLTIDGSSVSSGINQDNNNIFYDTSVSGATVHNGILTLNTGSIGSDIILDSGAELIATSGTTVSGVSIMSGASAQLQSDVIASDMTLYSGGSLSVSSNAVVSGLTLESGAQIDQTSGSTFVSAIIQSGAGIISSAGDTFISTTLNNGDIESLSGIVSGLTINAKGNDGGEFQTGQISGATLNGGALLIYVDSVASGVFVGSNAKFAVFSGSTATDVTVGESGSAFVSEDSLITQATVTSGGGLLTVSGGTLTQIVVSSGAQIIVSGGGMTQNDTLYNGGVINVSSGGSVADITFSGGGTVNLYSGGIDPLTIADHGVLNVSSGAVISGDIAETDGIINVLSGGLASDTVVSSGGTLYLTSGATISGVTSVISGGTTEINGTVSGGGSIDLYSGGVLVISGSTMPSNTIHFVTSGGIIDFTDLHTITSVSGTDESLTVNGQDADGTEKTYSLTTENGSDPANYVVIGNQLVEVCFLSDTLIRTPGGEVTVETLNIGDEVLTYAHSVIRAERITWVGRSHCTVRPHLPDDEAGYPVRILKNAVAEGVPFKDMLITSEHCLFFDGRFIPVRMLVNGRSVFYDKSITSYDYYHIETGDHAVIMADGMLTESYLDTGNRQAFYQHGKLVAFTPSRNLTWDDAAAPLDVSQQFAENIFRHIEERAEQMDLPHQNKTAELTYDPDLHLLTQTGDVIRQIRRQNGRALFMIPAGTASVTLMSRTSRPYDVVGPFIDDRRVLGVLVGMVTLLEGAASMVVDTHLTQNELAGWHSPENSRTMRWTKGDAVLPLGLSSEIRVLSVEVIATGPYRQHKEQPVNLKFAG
ncbi:Hint domain-containing protein [Acetobacter thailandicus]|uniref:Hint domain-containing protein n=1 Tax=Acetobacter thailandicus TaxID=1502842 RepID=UPI001BADF4B3|nr:Hint domain-containing protein [Acetobacter thailandicus]MBS0961459.1 Hint domain-containing protein [Acetobacter thailandicus]